MARKKGSGAKWLWAILLIILVVGAVAAFKIFGPNTGDLHEGEYVYIRTGSSYDDVKKRLKEGGFIKDMLSFDMLAERANYPAHLHPGKYHITAGMSNYNMVRMLRSGRQTPVRLVINKLRTKQDFIRLIGMNLEADSVTMLHMLADANYLAGFGLDTNTAMCAVMPDTYEFYWNTTADKAFKKIAKKYTSFWNDANVEKAKAQGLTQTQVITVASIVDEESNKNDEKPNIASVYLNRMRKGMKLQADPTVKFAIGDFTIRRITGVHLAFESPYNTYRITGLPPGPICTPSEASINAVLNAPHTDYIYFCAREDFSGYHRFASTDAEQAKNAKLYHEALDARGIH